MDLRPGLKLFSTVSDAQMVVVKAPAEPVEIACGGQPMSDAEPGEIAAGDNLGEGPQMGKRYADEEVGIELLCTRPGAGAITVNGTPLELKGAKPLPASD